jgi:hypothetical protein
MAESGSTDGNEPVTRIDFTPEQEAYLRWLCGFGPGDRELTPWDLIAALEAARVVDDEADHIRLFEPDLYDGRDP